MSFCTFALLKALGQGEGEPWDAPKSLTKLLEDSNFDLLLQGENYSIECEG